MDKLRILIVLVLLVGTGAFAQSVTLHSVVNDGNQVSVIYSKDFSTCAHLKDAETFSLVHTQNHFCTSGNNIEVVVDVSLLNEGADVGNEVILCHGNDGNICSDSVSITATPVESVSLSSVVLVSGAVEVSYSKNFNTCAHLLNENLQILHQQNVFCASGDDVELSIPESVFSGLAAGSLVQLCHGNNYNLCSDLLVVTEEVVDSVELHSATIIGDDLVLTYSKNFDTCAHLVDDSFSIYHQQNVFCSSGDEVTVTTPMNVFSGLSSGSVAKLCHGNNYNVCSELIGVVGSPEITGCIAQNGEVPTITRIQLKQKNEALQIVTADENGCYAFEEIQEGKRAVIKIIIEN